MNQAKHHLLLSINTSSVGQAGCVVSVTGKHTWNEFAKEGQKESVWQAVISGIHFECVNKGSL